MILTEEETNLRLNLSSWLYYAMGVLKVLLTCWSGFECWLFFVPESQSAAGSLHAIEWTLPLSLLSDSESYKRYKLFGIKHIIIMH